MSNEFLDNDGLEYLWGKMKAYVASHSSGGVSLDSVYPVGSIYMSVNNTNPGTLFGGTWVQIEDTFLLACGTDYAAGATGGEAEHTLTSAESGTPGLTHSVTQPAFKLPAHQHMPSTGNPVLTVPSGTTVGRTTVASGSGKSNVLTSTNAVAGTSSLNVSTDPLPACTRSTNAAVAAHAAADASSAHNNMPPYLAVYVWKRTA